MGSAPSRLRPTIPLLVLAVLAAFLTFPTSSALADTNISSSGPLTNIFTSSDLNCQVHRAGDSVGEFYQYPLDSSSTPACATLVAADGTLYGPASIDAGPSGQTPFTQVSQTTVGTGTAEDPFITTTVVNAGDLTITQSDTYVEGNDFYTTDVEISNGGEVSHSGVLYRAGDCYLGGFDTGLGAYDAETRSIACAADAGHQVLQWTPVTTGSSYFEGGYGQLWSNVGTQASFPDTCDCATSEDNGAGLSWDFSLDPGSQQTFTETLTVGAPDALTIGKVADLGTAGPGGTDGYTITVNNPNAEPVQMTTLVDNLPSGFVYNAGSTTGDTTADPTIDGGGALTWNDPFTAPAGGSASIHFEVSVGTSLGTFYNSADGTASGYLVKGTGDTAPVFVNGTGGGCEASPPGAPTDVVAYPGDASAAVSWTAPASDGGSPIDSYTVNIYDLSGGGYASTRSAPSTADSIQTTDTNASISGLINGDTYEFTVQATNCAGTGPESEPSNQIVPEPGSAAKVIGPGNLTETTSTTGSNVPTPGDSTIGVQLFPPGTSGIGTLTELNPNAPAAQVHGAAPLSEFCGGLNPCIGNILEAKLHGSLGAHFYRLKLLLDKTLVVGLRKNVQVWYDPNPTDDDTAGGDPTPPATLPFCPSTFAGFACVRNIQRFGDHDLRIVVKTPDIDPRLATSK